MNERGHPLTLEHTRGNLRALKSGAFSARTLAPRAAEVAAQLMELPHAIAIDEVAAAEIGMIVARIEAVDRDLDERGHFGRNGARSLLDHRARLTRELRSWMREFGGTPLSRATWAKTLADGGLAGEIARRRNGDA